MFIVLHCKRNFASYLVFLPAPLAREYFRGDVVAACALETGVSLRCIATDKSEANICSATSLEDTVTVIPKMHLESGRLKTVGSGTADQSLFNLASESAVYIEGIKYSWLTNISQKEKGNGLRGEIVDGSFDVYGLVRLPARKIRLTNSNIEFKYSLNGIEVYGVVIFVLEKILS
ncbi:hypothetical protein [Edaphovirga cremea]|uniref:hypothetical protein n=1 Tax=Edaphovirga cremea TaxID=2267246 RepID=UPI003989BFE7